MPDAETTQDVATAYSHYRRRLFGALAILARQGFAVQLTDGLDLIQEFFTEAWAGIEARYDPKRGPFDRYVFAAFVRFARPRILRLKRWQSCLVDAARLADLVSVNPVEQPMEGTGPTPEFIREVLLTLAPRDRDVLYSYLHAGARSERKLASEFAVTRYRIREILAEALGQIVVCLGERGVVSPSDWQVALALWRDGRTVRQTVGYLHRSADEIRESRSRIIALLAGRLRRLERGDSSRSRSSSMSPVREDPLELLKRVLSEPGNTQLLAEVRQRADELILYLDEADRSVDEEIREVRIDPNWLALVHEALAKEEPLSPAEQEVRAKLFEASADDEKSVGRAFKEALLADLPRQLTNWSYWFELVPRLSGEQQRYLLEQPAVRAAWPESEELVARGLTPVSVYYAAEAVAFLAEDALRRQPAAPEPAVRIRVQGSPLRNLPAVRAPLTIEPEEWPRWDDYQVIPPQLLVQEIIQMSECPLVTAQSLLPWLVAVAQLKPFLFADLQALPIGETGLQLTYARRGEGTGVEDRFDDDGGNLYRRWGRSS